MKPAPSPARPADEAKPAAGSSGDAAARTVPMPQFRVEPRVVPAATPGVVPGSTPSRNAPLAPPPAAAPRREQPAASHAAPISETATIPPSPGAYTPTAAEVAAMQIEPTTAAVRENADGDDAGMQSKRQPQMRLGDHLVHMGLISQDQLDVALYERKRGDKMLGEVLTEMGFITQSALSAVLAESAGLEQFDPSTAMFDPELITRVPKDIASRYKVIPVTMDGDVLQVAMSDPYDVLALDQLRRCFRRDIEVQPLLTSEGDISDAVDRLYGYEMSIDGILREIETGVVDIQALTTQDGYINPTVRLVNAIIMDAVKVGASDLHFEPEGQFVRLRYRIDGVLTQIRTFHKDYWPAISVRIKIISGMNIADTRNPQDGRLSLYVGGREVDFRVASHPTIHGENIVIRVLDKSKSLKPLEGLGFSDHNVKVMNTLLKRPEGIIVITGPTGSGKTTTLYAMLGKINSVRVNIMTLEDPVEYELPLIRQSHIREAGGMTFGEGVRSILRQDPDIVFIGEVRDADTATMALRAAMTGHQVYTTLHTNDALGALPRLVDLGLNASMLSGHIIGILAQRLVRKLCDHCKAARPATEEECRILGQDPSQPPEIYHAVGCHMCNNKGYRGRIAAVEILPFNDEMDEMVSRNASRAELRECAGRFGFRNMADDGVGKVLSGQTSVEELIGHIDMTDRML